MICILVHKAVSSEQNYTPHECLLKKNISENSMIIHNRMQYIQLSHYLGEASTLSTTEKISFLE